MAGPLDGLVVIDASWGMPGAIAGMLLADYGARVVKIERPGGGPDRGTTLRAVLDRGKWSVELDVATDSGAAVLDGLLTKADVFIESYGPRRARELGLSHDRIGDRHDHLVHCSLTGYGQDGPWADRPGFDSLVSARLGLMAEQRGHRRPPIFLGHSTVSYCTGFLATIGVLAALRARRFTGRGQLVDSSMLDGTLSVMSMNWWWNEKDLSYLARSGTETGFGRNRLITDLFQCGDGEFLMMHTGGDGAFKRTTDILGFGDRIRSVGNVEFGVPLDDDEYHVARHLVPEAFKSRARDEWIKLFHAADIAALPVLRPEEVLDDEQIRWANVVFDVDDPELGTVRQVGPVMRFADAPPDPPTVAPRVGEHNGRINDVPARAALEPIGTSPEHPLEHPLTGIRVLDFSAFFATAYGARLLCDLGADVVKVEQVFGDQMRPLADLFEGAQRGKRNLAIDIRRPEGIAVIHELVKSTDVVMHNLRPGKAEKLGIGAEQLRAINPNLIYCYLPGFGSSGPKKDLKSFAPLVSGFTGLLYIGTGRGQPPVKRVLGNEDLYNGMSGAVAVLMALEHRARTGRAQYVESPHLHSSLFVRSEQCTDGRGVLTSTLQLDPQQYGWGPLYRLYETAGDGWICIACVGRRAFERLKAALELPAGLGADDPDLATVLAARFGELSADDAFARLDGAGVPCEIPIPDPYMPDFLWDEWAFETDRVFEHQHPEHGWIREMGFVVRLSETPGENKGPSTRLGQHTREILSEIGYDTETIDAMVAAGTVKVVAEAD
jgi:crotonobetainyl-CoA:carnitine CoA-transferase CaiB-like acyl-CoA transferase